MFQPCFHTPPYGLSNFRLSYTFSIWLGEKAEVTVTIQPQSIAQRGKFFSPNLSIFVNSLSFLCVPYVNHLLYFGGFCFCGLVEDIENSTPSMRD